MATPSTSTRAWRGIASCEAAGRDVPKTPFERLTYDDVIRRYGTDKPDLRYGLEIEDATALTRGSRFGVFAAAPVVRYVVAPRPFSRAEEQGMCLLPGGAKPARSRPRRSRGA